jgi:drug/metabolite transporter (DMT)-like permease
MTSVASSVVLVTTTPLWVALFAPLVLREPFSRRILLGMLVALAGGVIVGLSENCVLSTGGVACASFGDLLEGGAFPGNFLALVGAWTAAFYIMAGRRMRSSLSLVGYTFVVYGSAAVVLLLMVLVSGQSLVGYPAETYGIFLLLALVPQLLGHSSFNWALRYLPAAFVSVALLGEPVGAILLTMLFLGEIPALLELVGGVLILGGIFIASWKKG